ncbi:MAG: hypothetical protein DWQ01_20175 [Planctomycetota bacterium]|nr:MAG: hypothetical protein DWQ01_20175 [Planctomycetota bacterium]
MTLYLLKRSQLFMATVLIALLGFSFSLPGQEPPKPAQEQEEEAKEGGEKKKEAEEPAEEKDEDAEEPEESPYLAIVGGDVYTVTGGVVHGGTVLVKEDRILKVGKNISVPEGARTIDATGMHVYPGLVALNSSGIHTGGSKPEDSFRPYNLTLDLALAGGITSAQANGSVAKLTRGTLDGMFVREKVWLSLSYSTTAPSSRRRMRNEFLACRNYLREMDRYQAAKARGEEDLKEPDASKLNKGYLQLLQGQAQARFNANTVKDLMTVCEFLEEFPMKAVVFGAQEAWIVAPRLGRTGARVVVNPRSKRLSNQSLSRPSGWSIENARVLHDAGVEVAVLPSQTYISTGGITGRDLMTLPLEATFAIRGGLPQEQALRSITLIPAKVLGIGHRVGSIEAGKDADLIVTDGDLFDYRTFVQWTVVNGQVVYDKQEAPYFAHIRPRPEPTPQEVMDSIRKAAKKEEGDAEEEEGAEKPPDAPEKESGSK